ncbi:MAG: hypothetical protein QGG40_08015 [Myxococcota bacterium]|jgi:lysophospholipase L1-like esterase|nr:hypothetical protein [Myxococcota bacterium]
MLPWLLGSGLLGAGAMALRVPRGAPHRVQFVIRGSCLLISIVAVGLSCWIALARSGVAWESDEILTFGDLPMDQGVSGRMLRAGLVDSKVVIPDRPHNPDETTQADRKRRITRRRTFTVSTNSLGLRGPEVQVPAPGFRIVCLGDSVTFGWGVEFEETYPARLAADLGVEVINAGFPALDATGLARWAETNLKGLDPDLVLFSKRPPYHVVNPWLIYKQAVRAITATVGLNRMGVVLPPPSHFIPTEAGMDEEGQRVQFAVSPVPVLDLTRGFRSAVQDNLQSHRGGVIMRQTGSTQLLLQLPDMNTVAQGQAESMLLSDDIIEAFEENPDWNEPLFFDQAHPNAEGQALMAQLVAQWVRQKGWIP